MTLIFDSMTSELVMQVEHIKVYASVKFVGCC